MQSKAHARSTASPLSFLATTLAIGAIVSLATLAAPGGSAHAANCNPAEIIKIPKYRDRIDLLRLEAGSSDAGVKLVSGQARFEDLFVAGITKDGEVVLSNDPRARLDANDKLASRLSGKLVVERTPLEEGIDFKIARETRKPAADSPLRAVALADAPSESDLSNGLSTAFGHVRTVSVILDSRAQRESFASGVHSLAFRHTDAEGRTWIDVVRKQLGEDPAKDILPESKQARAALASMTLEEALQILEAPREAGLQKTIAWKAKYSVAELLVDAAYSNEARAATQRAGRAVGTEIQLLTTADGVPIGTRQAEVAGKTLGEFAAALKKQIGPQLSREQATQQLLDVKALVEQKLQDLHRVGYLHGDIREGNILVSEIGGKLSVELIDFRPRGVADVHLDYLRAAQALRDVGRELHKFPLPMQDYEPAVKGQAAFELAVATRFAKNPPPAKPLLTSTTVTAAVSERRKSTGKGFLLVDRQGTPVLLDATANPAARGMPAWVHGWEDGKLLLTSSETYQRRPAERPTSVAARASWRLAPMDGARPADAPTADRSPIRRADAGKRIVKQADSRYEIWAASGGEWSKADPRSFITLDYQATPDVKRLSSGPQDARILDFKTGKDGTDLVVIQYRGNGMVREVPLAKVAGAGSNARVSDASRDRFTKPVYEIQSIFESHYVPFASVGEQEMKLNADSVFLQSAVKTALEVIRANTPAKATRREVFEAFIKHVVPKFHSDEAAEAYGEKVTAIRKDSSLNLGTALERKAAVCRELSLLAHLTFAELGYETKVGSGLVEASQLKSGRIGHVWLETPDGLAIDFNNLMEVLPLKPYLAMVQGKHVGQSKTQTLFRPAPAALEKTAARAADTLDQARKALADLFTLGTSKAETAARLESARKKIEAEGGSLALVALGSRQNLFPGDKILGFTSEGIVFVERDGVRIAEQIPKDSLLVDARASSSTEIAAIPPFGSELARASSSPPPELADRLGNGLETAFGHVKTERVKLASDVQRTELDRGTFTTVFRHVDRQKRAWIDVVSEALSSDHAGSLLPESKKQRQALASMTLERARKILDSYEVRNSSGGMPSVFGRAERAVAEIIVDAAYTNEVRAATARAGRPLATKVQILTTADGVPIGSRQLEVAGESLSQFISGLQEKIRAGKLTADQARQKLSSAHSLVEAQLGELHRAGYFHGDIRENSVRIREQDGKLGVGLIDFEARRGVLPADDFKRLDTWLSVHGIDGYEARPKSREQLAELDAAFKRAIYKRLDTADRAALAARPAEIVVKPPIGAVAREVTPVLPGKFTRASDLDAQITGARRTKLQEGVSSVVESFERGGKQYVSIELKRLSRRALEQAKGLPPTDFVNDILGAQAVELAALKNLPMPELKKIAESIEPDGYAKDARQEVARLLYEAAYTNALRGEGAPAVTEIITNERGVPIGMVQEKVPGERLHDLWHDKKLTPELLKEIQRQLESKLVDGRLHHGDPHYGNIIVDLSTQPPGVRLVDYSPFHTDYEAQFALLSESLSEIALRISGPGGPIRITGSELAAGGESRGQVALPDRVVRSQTLDETARTAGKPRQYLGEGKFSLAETFERDGRELVSIEVVRLSPRAWSRTRDNKGAKLLDLSREDAAHLAGLKHLPMDEIKRIALESKVFSAEHTVANLLYDAAYTNSLRAQGAPEVVEIIVDHRGIPIGMVQERVKGETLASLVESGKIDRAGFDQVRSQVLELLRGKRIHHGDPHGKNIMVDLSTNPPGVRLINYAPLTFSYDEQFIRFYGNLSKLGKIVDKASPVLLDARSIPPGAKPRAVAPIAVDQVIRSSALVERPKQAGFGTAFDEDARSVVEVFGRDGKQYVSVENKRLSPRAWDQMVGTEQKSNFHAEVTGASAPELAKLRQLPIAELKKIAETIPPDQTAPTARQEIARLLYEAAYTNALRAEGAPQMVEIIVNDFGVPVGTVQEKVPGAKLEDLWDTGKLTPELLAHVRQEILAKLGAGGLHHGDPTFQNIIVDSSTSPATVRLVDYSPLRHDYAGQFETFFTDFNKAATQIKGPLDRESRFTTNEDSSDGRHTFFKFGEPAEAQTWTGADKAFGDLQKLWTAEQAKPGVSDHKLREIESRLVAEVSKQLKAKGYAHEVAPDQMSIRIIPIERSDSSGRGKEILSRVARMLAKGAKRAFGSHGANSTNTEPTVLYAPTRARKSKFAGSFDWSTGDVVLGGYAPILAADLLTFTLSHELRHAWIRRILSGRPDPLPEFAMQGILMTSDGAPLPGMKAGDGYSLFRAADEVESRLAEAKVHLASLSRADTRLESGLSKTATTLRRAVELAKSDILSAKLTILTLEGGLDQAPKIQLIATSRGDHLERGFLNHSLLIHIPDGMTTGAMGSGAHTVEIPGITLRSKSGEFRRVSEAYVAAANGSGFPELRSQMIDFAKAQLELLVARREQLVRALDESTVVKPDDNRGWFARTFTAKPVLTPDEALLARYKAFTQLGKIRARRVAINSPFESDPAAAASAAEYAQGKLKTLRETPLSSPKYQEIAHDAYAALQQAEAMAFASGPKVVAPARIRSHIAENPQPGKVSPESRSEGIAFLKQHGFAVDSTIQVEPGRELTYPAESAYYYTRRLVEDIKVKWPESLSEAHAFAEKLAMGDPQRAMELTLHHFLEPKEPIDLRQYLGNLVKDRIGKASVCEGLSCHDAAMNFHDLFFAPEVLTESTYEKILEHGFSTLAQGEKLQFGDVIVFRNELEPQSQQSDIYHSAVYIGDGLVFNKASIDSADPYVFETLSSVARHYVASSDSEPFELMITVHRPIPGVHEKAPLLADGAQRELREIHNGVPNNESILATLPEAVTTGVQKQVAVSSYLDPVTKVDAREYFSEGTYSVVKAFKRDGREYLSVENKQLSLSAFKEAKKPPRDGNLLDEALGRHVNAKEREALIADLREMPKRPMAELKNIARDPTASRIRREVAKVLYQAAYANQHVESHRAPRIVEILIDERGIPIGTVQERLPGETLYRLVEDGRITQPQYDEAVGQVFAQLNAGLHHGDPQFANVIVNLADGKVDARLIDYSPLEATYDDQWNAFRFARIAADRTMAERLPPTTLFGQLRKATIDGFARLAKLMGMDGAPSKYSPADTIPGTLQAETPPRSPAERALAADRGAQKLAEGLVIRPESVLVLTDADGTKRTLRILESKLADEIHVLESVPGQTSRQRVVKLTDLQGALLRGEDVGPKRADREVLTQAIAQEVLGRDAKLKPAQLDLVWDVHQMVKTPIREHTTEEIAAKYKALVERKDATGHYLVADPRLRATLADAFVRNGVVGRVAAAIAMAPELKVPQIKSMDLVRKEIAAANADPTLDNLKQGTYAIPKIIKRGTTEYIVLESKELSLFAKERHDSPNNVAYVLDFAIGKDVPEPTRLRNIEYLASMHKFPPEELKRIATNFGPVEPELARLVYARRAVATLLYDAWYTNAQTRPGQGGYVTEILVDANRIPIGTVQQRVPGKSLLSLLEKPSTQGGLSFADFVKIKTQVEDLLVGKEGRPGIHHGDPHFGNIMVRYEKGEPVAQLIDYSPLHLDPVRQLDEFRNLVLDASEQFAKRGEKAARPITAIAKALAPADRRPAGLVVPLSERMQDLLHPKLSSTSPRPEAEAQAVKALGEYWKQLGDQRGKALDEAQERLKRVLRDCGS